MQIQIAQNQGDADLARARKQAQQQIVMSEADLERSRRRPSRRSSPRKAESQQRMLAGKGEGQRLLQIGLAEASVLMQKVSSFGDPRLYALALVAEHLSKSQQPLVPQQMFVAGGGGSDGNGSSGSGQGLLGTLIGLMVAEKSGFHFDGNGQSPAIKELAERLSRQALEAMQSAGNDIPASSAINDAEIPAKVAKRMNA